MPEGCVGPGGEKLYLRLKKALYGLRSAALHWTRHLSGLLGKLFGLKPCPTEVSRVLQEQTSFRA